MINEICLYIHSHEKFSEVQQELFAIPELYLSFIPKFDSKKVIKCIIFLCENKNFPPKEKILGCATSYQFFDFPKYLSLDDTERKRLQLEIIHQEMIGIAVDYNWDTEPLEIAYQSCLASDLVFKKQIKKRKLSPNRKFYLSLWAYCDLHYFKIIWDVSDKKGKTIRQGALLTEQPSFIEIWYRLNFHWVDDENFLVESNYKGLVTDTWEINLNGQT